METTVVNVRNQECDYYLGRQNPKFAGKAFLNFSLGNPFAMRNESERKTVIDKYRDWLNGRMQTEPELASKMSVLKGKRLGCWCAPKACHCDVVKEIVDGL